jgi:DNA-directed RNA polymerase subunit L
LPPTTKVSNNGLPDLQLKTKDADPLEVMKEAVSRIIAQCEEFSALYSAAVK